MATTLTRAPQKLREMHNHHFDSTIWNDFAFRDDDVIIATYGKSGTTWTQQIVGQLLSGGDARLNVSELSPWMDLRVPPKEMKLAAIEAQMQRRFLKTHLPIDALVFSQEAKYIYVGRDGRDVVWSLHNHHFNAGPIWFQALNDSPGRVGPPIPHADADLRAYFRTWFDGDGEPFWPFWENIRSWWAVRDLPNVHFVHFEDLKRDMGREIRGIADFLGVEINEARWPNILEHCSFDWMKANAAQITPLGGIFWDGGAGVFVNKGTNGRWRDTLTDADIADYEAKALAELGPECAAWLAAGYRR